MKEKCTALCEKWFRGDVTLPKVTLWLACSTCLLAGIVYGIKKAPWTHGVTIGSNNGNNNGNDNGNNNSDIGGNSGSSAEYTGDEEEKEN